MNNLFSGKPKKEKDPNDETYSVTVIKNGNDYNVSDIFGISNGKGTKMVIKRSLQKLKRIWPPEGNPSNAVSDADVRTADSETAGDSGTPNNPKIDDDSETPNNQEDDSDYGSVVDENAEESKDSEEDKPVNLVSSQIKRINGLKGEVPKGTVSKGGTRNKRKNKRSKTLRKKRRSSKSR
jgi:hypothetical protein